MTHCCIRKFGVSVLRVLVILYCAGSCCLFSHTIGINHYSYSYDIDEINFKFIKTATFDKNTLLDLMTTSRKSNFIHEDLEKDMMVIKKFYFDNGFFNAIVDTATDYNDVDLTVNITIIILEKNRYKINNIKYTGLEQVKPDLLSKLHQDVLIKQGINYDRSLILSESNMIIELLQNNGYAFARSDTTIVEKSPTEDFVNLTIRFLHCKKQYYFGTTRVKITDNKYQLTDYLIMRELDYNEGDLYSKLHIIQSERNFTNFSIIQSARLHLDTVIEAASKINYVVTITLTDKYELTPSLIGTDIDNQFYVGAGLNYSDKNFFGGGRVFSIGVTGYVHSRLVNLAEIRATFFQPFFLQNTTTAAYDIKFGIYNLTDRLQTILLRNLIRVTFTLPTYTFYNKVLTDLTGDLVRSKIKYPQDSNPNNLLTIITNSMNSIIGFTVINDNTNDVFNPSKGFYHTFSFENAGLLPKLINVLNPNLDYSQYVKLFSLNKLYYDLSGNRMTSIFATYNRIGDIMEYGHGSNIVPVDPIYKFYSGGSGSVRGWDAKHNGIVADPTLGGNFIFEGSFEHRIHPYPENDNFLKNIWVVYFLDYGNIWENAKFFRLNEIALAIGFGARYNTFVGPVRIDLGFKLYDPNASNDTRWLFNKKGRIFADKLAFQFGIGNAF